MSFGFGISDAVWAAGLVVQAYKTCVGAPNEIDDAKTEVENMMGILEYLGKLVERPDSPVKKGDKEQHQSLKTHMKHLEMDLLRIADLVEKWGNFSQLGWAEAKLKKTMYIMTDLRTVDDLCQGLEKHYKRIDQIVQILQFSGIGAAEKALDRLQKLQQKQKLEEQERATANQKWLELLKEHGPEEIAAAAGNTKQWNELRQLLLKKGMSEHDTEASMDTVKNCLDTLETAPIHSSAPLRPKLRQLEVRILCVDEFNAIRSVITQAYLECLRAWSANIRKDWLFANVDSAGCWLESSFLKEHQVLVGTPLKPTSNAPSNAALEALAAQPRFLSFEKDEIFARLRARKTRGVMARDFNNFDYILCFDKNVYDLLEKLTKHPEKEKGLEKFKLVLIEGTAIDQDLDKTCNSIKIPISNWLKAEFGWERPGAQGIKSGPWRTLQFLVDVNYFKALKANHWKVSKELQKSYGCKIFGAPENWHNKRSVISIIGKKENLHTVKGKILALEV